MQTNAFEHEATYLLALTLMTTMVGSASPQTQSQPDAWNLALTLRESRALDRVRSGEPAEDRIIDAADASLGYSTRTERSNVGFFGRVGGNMYQDELSEDQITYGAGFSWNYRATERSNMSLTQSVNKNLRLDTLASLGLSPNDLDTLSANTQWSFQGQSGPRTSWSTGLGYNFAELRSLVPIQGSQIVLDEQPFGDEISIPLIDTSDPTQVALPDGETDILRILATEGLSDRNARSQQAYASFGLNHSIGQRTSLGFSLNGGYRSIETAQAQNGPMGVVQMFLQQATSTASAVSVGYTFQSSFAIEPNVTIQTLFTGWSYTPEDSTVSFSVLGGASRFQAEGRDTTTQPVASALFSGNITESTTAGVSYRRQFSMPLGFGQSLLIDYADANINQAIGARVNAIANAGLSFGADPLDDGSKLDTRRAGGSVTVRIVGGLSAGTSYFYVENEQQTAVSNFEDSYKNWSFYLAYGTNW
jgi:hypothetical protein